MGSVIDEVTRKALARHAMDYIERGYFSLPRKPPPPLTKWQRVKLRISLHVSRAKRAWLVLRGLDD